ncbi:hypothetical protein GUJ93_ZPchr0009g477 [Zizania palustris]|uniref:Uncharacterized protein n=1 Tax=Zizania palustris TaxID=103762 RepID=A0A8J5RJ14_ZIZPA|nr:hypothetical protein GUJ93_ZPchr0009g477 [Zizania palustris]
MVLTMRGMPRRSSPAQRGNTRPSAVSSPLRQLRSCVAHTQTNEVPPQVYDAMMFMRGSLSAWVDSILMARN